jgi:glutathione S-transferase
MSLTLYWAPRSSASRITWAIEELEVPCEKVRLDLRAGDQRKPEYLALNPNGKVPLVVDDGVPIFESAAILVHLGERYGRDKSLWPAASSKEHGQALAWVVWSAATLQPIMFRYLMNTQERFPPAARNANQAESARIEIDKLADIVEARLTEKPYFLGDSFTFVDLAVAAALGFWRMSGHDFSLHAHVAKWLDACQARPAFKAAMSAT